MRNLKQSTATNVMVLMVDATDHVTGETGLTLTVTASKDGAAFAPISPTVTERGNGWYNLALTTAHTDTLGDLALHVTGTGADPADLLCRVVAGSLDADVSTRLATAGYTAPDNVSIVEVRKLLRNKRVLDPVTGIETIYDDDGSPLFTRAVYQDAAGTVPYADAGADRVERYT